MSETTIKKDYVEMSNTRRVLAFLSIAVIYFFYCYNFTITAIYQPILIDNYGFDALDLAKAFGFMSFGTLIGTVLAGYLATKINKKAALIIMTLGFSLPTLLHIPTYQNETAWMVLRLIAGVSLGGIFGTAVALICDMFPSKYRGRLTSLASSLFALAWAFGFYVSKVTASTNQYMVLILGAVVPLIGIVLTIIFVPNTDQMLKDADIERGDTAALNEKKPTYIEFIKSAPLIVLMAVILSGMNFTGYSGFNNNVALYISDEVNQEVEQAIDDGELLTGDIDSEIVYNGDGEIIIEDEVEVELNKGDIINIEQAKLVLRNDSRSMAAGSVGNVGFGHFIGFIFFGFIGDYFGRKKNIIGMLISVAAGSAILLYNFSGSMIPYTVLGLILGFGYGYSGVWGAYYSELFDKRYRGMAAGFCFNMGRVISMFTVPYIGKLVTENGVEKTLWIPLGAFVVGAIVWAVFLPETLKKNKVDEISDKEVA